MAVSAQRMVELLEEALSNNIGVSSIQVDGQTISFSDRSKMIEEYNFWLRRVQREAGTKPLFRSLDIS